MNSTDKMVRKPNSGFTIIEVMMVLSVSSLILLFALHAMSGKTNQTEFDTAINQVRAKIQQTISDVSNGYYPSSNNFNCNPQPGGGPTFDIGTNPGHVAGDPNSGTARGSNAGCVLMGSAVQFGSGADTRVRTYTLASNRYTDGTTDGHNGGTLVRSLSDSPARILQDQSDHTNAGVINADTYDLAYGLTLKWMCANGPCPPVGTGTVINTVVFASSPIGNDNTTADPDGSQRVDVYPVLDSPVPATTQTMLNAIHDIDVFLASSPINPGRVDICLQSATTNQSGLITIADPGNNGSVSVDLSIKDSSNCS